MTTSSEREFGKRLWSSTGNLKSEHTDYSPSFFLRCHSKKTEAVDKKTSVWSCAFEPSSPLDNNSVFATCGGNSICIINAADGSVKTKHYAKESDEDFTALAWTTLPTLKGSINILAVAGKKFLHLLHPDKALCFAEHSVGKKLSRNFGIESLVFHPEQHSMLFGVSSKGDVFFWDIGKPHPPEYKSNLDLLQVINLDCSANALTFSSYCCMLLCATERGAVGWAVPFTTLTKNQTLKEVRFCFPTTNENIAINDRYYVDSVEAIGDGKIIATKCANHGYIYIWDLEKALKMVPKSIRPLKEIKINALIVDPLHSLKWSSTDNFYMNIGVDARGEILACGDDIGNLWMYNIEEILASKSQKHECSNIIAWPDVKDQKSQRRKMLSFYGTSDIVINKVTLSYDASFLIAVTSTNIVCIWKKDD